MESCSKIVSPFFIRRSFNHRFLPFTPSVFFFPAAPAVSWLIKRSVTLFFFFLFSCVCVCACAHACVCLCVRAHTQDMMDDICQEQFMEMSYLNGGQEHGGRVRGGMPVRGRGVPPAGAHRCVCANSRTQISISCKQLPGQRTQPRRCLSLVYQVIAIGRRKYLFSATTRLRSLQSNPGDGGSR